MSKIRTQSILVTVFNNDTQKSENRHISFHDLPMLLNVLKADRIKELINNGKMIAQNESVKNIHMNTISMR
jgi:hypothetical protein